MTGNWYDAMAILKKVCANTYADKMKEYEEDFDDEDERSDIAWDETLDEEMDSIKEYLDGYRYDIIGMTEEEE